MYIRNRIIIVHFKGGSDFKAEDTMRYLYKKKKKNLKLENKKDQIIFI